MLARDIIRRENISTIHVNKRLIIIFLLTKILITIPKMSFIFHRSRDNSKKKKEKKFVPKLGENRIELNDTRSAIRRRLITESYDRIVNEVII